MKGIILCKAYGTEQLVGDKIIQRKRLFRSIVPMIVMSISASQ